MYLTFHSLCSIKKLLYVFLQKLKELIRTEYKVQKEDIKYIEQKKRFEYLHKKLGFIKELILDYDRSQAIVDS